MDPEYTPVEMQQMLNEVYADRNRVVQLAATLADRLGYRVGVRIDRDEPEWPVLMIDLPTGQISWHLSPGDAYPVWDLYDAEWDGHTDADKAERIRRYVVPPWPSADERRTTP